MSLGVFSGDWHIHNYAQFSRPWLPGLNNRAKHIYEVVGAYIPAWMDKYNVEFFCHMGDWHVNDSNDYRLINLALVAARKCAGERVVFAIGGNHDTVESGHMSYNGRPYFPQECWKSGDSFAGWEFIHVGYNTPLPEPKDVKGKKVVILLHKDIVGGKTAQGFVYRSGHAIQLSELLALKKAATQALFFGGHYHERQTIGNIVQIVGAPVQHNRGDANSKRGFIAWDTESMTIKFIQCPGPQFVVGALAEIQTIQSSLNERSYVTIDTPNNDIVARKTALEFIHDMKIVGVVREAQATQTVGTSVVDVKAAEVPEEELLDRWFLKYEPKLTSAERLELIKLAKQL